MVVAHRDSLGSPSVADLSGTAVLLELARVLSGETQHRSIVLASTSGSAGQAGATELARSLGSPVDAVIALGDLAGNRVQEPVVVPWSNGTGIASPMLRNTVAAALRSQANLRPGGASLAAQLAHVEEPLHLSIMGCAVNGPGEAHDSQLGITFGRGVGMIFKDGVPMRKVAGEDIVEAFVKETEKLLAEGATAKPETRHELVTIT